MAEKVPAAAVCEPLHLVLEHSVRGRKSESTEQEATGLGKTPPRRGQASWASTEGRKREKSIWGQNKQFSQRQQGRIGSDRIMGAGMPAWW